jgi:hypothetical protein
MPIKTENMQPAEHQNNFRSKRKDQYMSFDLHFYKKKDATISETNIRDYLNSLIVNDDNSSNDQWFYQNKETGVYFSIDYGNFDDKEDIDINNLNFKDFEDTQFSFNINFLRPHFFGLETFPIVARFVDEFDLYILNPQDLSEVEEPRKYTAEELLNNWAETNAEQSAIFLEKNQNGLAYHPLTDSIESWKFCFGREKLQDSLNDDIFVAGIFYLKPKGENIVKTLSIWPESIPVILPPTDFVYINKKIKRLFKTVEIKGLVAFETVMSTMETFFDVFECDIKNCHILSPENSLKVKKIYNSLNIIGDIPDYGSGITVDNIVNYKNS